MWAAIEVRGEFLIWADDDDDDHGPDTDVVPELRIPTEQTHHITEARQELV